MRARGVAVAARAARDVRVHDHPLATGEPGHVGADLDDFAGELVTDRHARSSKRILTGGYVEISATQARRLHPDLQLARTCRPHLAILDLYALAAWPYDARAHGYSPVTAPRVNPRTR